jgi:cytochrome c5
VFVAFVAVPVCLVSVIASDVDEDDAAVAKDTSPERDASASAAVDKSGQWVVGARCVLLWGGPLA